LNEAKQTKWPVALTVLAFGWGCGDKERFQLIPDVSWGDGDVDAHPDLSERDVESETDQGRTCVPPGDNASDLVFDPAPDYGGGSGEACGIDVLDETGGIRLCWSELGPGRVSMLCDEDAGRCVAPTTRCVCGWCYVPPRMFLAGWSGAVGERPSSYPDGMVSLRRGLWVQQHETSLAEFETLMGYQPDFTSGCGPDCPAAGVSIFEAMEFANRLSDREGRSVCYELHGCRNVWLEPDGARPTRAARSWLCDEATFPDHDCDGYRLPSWVEWEHLAKGGSPYCFPTGPYLEGADESAPNLDIVSDYAVYEGDGDPDYRPCATGEDDRRCRGPRPRGTKRPNAFGLYDVFGNVTEHTFSLWEPVPYDDAVFDGVPPYALFTGGRFAATIRPDTTLVIPAGTFYDDGIMSCGYFVSQLGFTAVAVANQATGFRLVRTTPLRFEDD
jgi:formylglycine-generating enzyme required for sulfatase activity